MLMGRKSGYVEVKERLVFPVEVSGETREVLRLAGEAMRLRVETGQVERVCLTLLCEGSLDWTEESIDDAGPELSDTADVAFVMGVIERCGRDDRWDLEGEELREAQDRALSRLGYERAALT